jgi:tRNA threonylcarbamoyladenosine biosynthesis protein TsaB
VLILAADTSSPSGSLAVLRDEELIAERSETSAEAYSSRMFRHLETLLRETSLTLDQFDLFAVVTGPGSFTGLRVGLSAAKAWAEVYKKPIAAISGLEAVAAQGRSAASVVVPVLDARRAQVYFGFYRRTPGGRMLDGEERVANREEFLEALRALAKDCRFCIVTPEPNAVSGMLSHFEPGLAELELVSPFLAPAAGRLGFRRAQRGQVTDALSLDANYVRRSDAEEQAKGSGAL